jgi:hypothetical protein
MTASRSLAGPATVGLLLVGGLIVGLVAHPAPVLAQQVVSCPAPAGIVGELTHPFAAVRYLADDLLEGRLSGSVGERCAAEYIAVEFERIGLAPGGVQGGYLQPVSLRTVMNPHAPAGVGMNVVGVLEGSDPELRDETVVLGAHHDHLGRGELFGSLATADDPDDAIHNGADDNASGVGVLLAAAEALAAGPAPARTIVFVTFTGEEFGLLGSAHYVENPATPLEGTVAMVNLDMVGRLEEDPLIVNGTGTAEEWDVLLDSLEVAEGIPMVRSPEGFGPSDHTSFYARDIPVLHLFTNVHGDYHRPSDEWHQVDREGMDRIASLVTGILRDVADRPAPITHLAGAGAPPGGADAGYGSWLGTVPDFAPVDYGVRLSGVSGGSPAEEVGMQAGDVLIRLGSFEIDDLYALTDALAALEPGMEVEAVYLRDGEEVSVSVVLGQR